MREYIAYLIQSRMGYYSTFKRGGKLFQQFLVDAYMMIESYRLNYYRNHQDQLRVDIYKGLTDAMVVGETEASARGKRIILPSSFTGFLLDLLYVFIKDLCLLSTINENRIHANLNRKCCNVYENVTCHQSLWFAGGARYTHQNYQDAMTICCWAGFPDLFITFTCNSKWPEIIRYLEANNFNVEDCPDVITRVFKVKLDSLMHDLVQGILFGPIKAGIYDY